MPIAIRIARSSATITSCSVFFITRQSSGRIGWLSSSPVAEVVRDRVPRPVAVAHEDGVVEVLLLGDAVEPCLVDVGRDADADREGHRRPWRRT